jgi:hypothetical protein
LRELPRANVGTASRSVTRAETKNKGVRETGRIATAAKSECIPNIILVATETTELKSGIVSAGQRKRSTKRRWSSGGVSVVQRGREKRQRRRLGFWKKRRHAGKRDVSVDSPLS